LFIGDLVSAHAHSLAWAVPILKWLVGFDDQDDFLFPWRREVHPFQFGEEIRRETDAPGELSEGVAFLQVELAYKGAEGLFHSVTYSLDSPPLSMKHVAADGHEPERRKD
jgi:hypothetical protein